MIQLIVLALVFCLSAIGAYAQKADFSGKWTLDAARSKLDERGPRIESMTLTVTQTATELKVETATKRAAPPEGMGGGMGRGGGRGFGAGDGTVSYNLEGKETVIEIDGPNGKMPVKYKGSIEGGKANLTNSRSISGQMGEITITTKETWSLSDDGKSLTVNREMSTPRGTMTSTLVFTKG